MTAAGGKTIHRPRQVRSQNGARTVVSYELAVSAPLLFQTFREETRPITVTGIRCADRLEALQRIVEHEMVHLLELLVWRDSSCSQERFQRLANNLFGHTASHHHLVSQREIAHADFGIKVGDRVRFDYDGVQHTGVVNRITKRVTVLVEHSSGLRYSDGKCYLKFYVPLPMLERVAPPPTDVAPTAVAGIRVDKAGIAWITGTTTRVIDVVLRKSASGASPEALQAEIPHLTLAQIYAALAHYHAHQPAMDAEVERERRRGEAPRSQASSARIPAEHPAPPRTPATQAQGSQASQERAARKKQHRGKHRRR
jgi:uncharacterized protein (DUF433 family)